MNDPWPLVHAERAALVDDLAAVDACDWDRPSLCRGWSVHDVVAHLVDNALTTRLSFATQLVRAGFDVDHLNARGVARERGAPAAVTLARLREVAGRTTTPPAPLDSRLVEEVVHGEDVRRPLGLTRDYPPEVLERALRSQPTTPTAFGGAREVGKTVRLCASDADLTVGQGPEVRGPLLALLLVLSGRRAALAELEGPGTALLAR